MGIRSDVAIAVKGLTVAKLLENIKSVAGLVDETSEHPEGALVCLRDVKWNASSPHVIAVYDWLNTLQSDDYLVREACFQYPESEDGDDGDWTDNPWSLSKEFSVSLFIKGTNESQT